jgi:Predicted transcriptional regulator
MSRRFQGPNAINCAGFAIIALLLYSAAVRATENDSLIGKPVIGRNADGHLEVFKVDEDGELRTHHHSQSAEIGTAVKKVHPCRIAYVNNLWTLFGSYTNGAKVQKFVFFRVSRLELTDEQFAETPPLDFNKELEGSMGVFKGMEKHEVAIEFDAWGADDVRARRWHVSQELSELSHGGLRVKMTLNNLEEVERWVLGFGTHATVIEPRELRERVEATAEKIRQKYL